MGKIADNEYWGQFIGGECPEMYCDFGAPMCCKRPGAGCVLCFHEVPCPIGRTIDHDLWLKERVSPEHKQAYTDKFITKKGAET